MTIRIEDRSALLAVSPAALAAYARAEGWAKTETYGSHSDVYNGGTLPEIIVPRTNHLADYASVVARLIKIFADVAEMSEIALHNDLVTADRDVIRVRVDGEDNTVDINSGTSLVSGARDMLLAAACSLNNPRPLYRAGANREAVDFVNQVRLGQTEPGSFVVTLLPPMIAPPTQKLLTPDMGDINPPVARRVTRRLYDALVATRKALESTMGGDTEAFTDAIVSGASANLCDALAQMTEPFHELEVRVTWARTRPVSTSRSTVRFNRDDTPVLSEAARGFRNREPIPDVHLPCSVQKLQRDDGETDGTVTLRTAIKDKIQSVTAVLSQSDYNRAIDAHKGKVPIIATGDLDRFRQRWRLLNPRIVAVITDEDTEPDRNQAAVATGSGPS